MEKKKQWITHNNEAVPAKYVSGYDKKKETALVRLLKEAKAVNKKLEDLKKSMFDNGDQLNDLMYKEHSMTRPIDSKGNFTMYSFNKGIRFTVRIQDVVDFDDHIKLAQEKINEFLASKTEGADPDLIVLVNNAFKTTKGRLDKSRIFSLFSLKINNPIWNEAIELIKKSITTNNTKRYASIAERDGNGEYKDVQLNISSI